jgi:tricorn protease
VTVLAVDFRGEIFLVPTDPETRREAAGHALAWRDRFQVYSPDGRSIAYISDESLEEEIWIYDMASGQRRKLTTTNPSRATDLVAGLAAPRVRRGEPLFEADVASGSVNELGFNRGGGYAGVELLGRRQVAGVSPWRLRPEHRGLPPGDRDADRDTT